MADHFQGTIAIAKGRYPQSIWNEMKELAAADFEDTGDRYEATNLHLRNGEFEELESYLVEQGIPFDRSSEGFCEIQPEIRIFRPGLIDKVIITDNESNNYVTTDDLRKALSVDLPHGEILKAIQALVNEKDPQYPPIFEYTIKWADGYSGELYSPDAEAVGNENVRVVAVLGDQT